MNKKKSKKTVDKASIEDKGDWVLINGWMLIRKDRIDTVQEYHNGVLIYKIQVVGEEALPIDLKNIGFKELMEVLTSKKEQTDNTYKDELRILANYCSGWWYEDEGRRRSNGTLLSDMPEFVIKAETILEYLDKD